MFLRSTIRLQAMSDRLVSHFGRQGLPHVPIAARLSERVTVALGMNPSDFSLQGTNTYLVGTGAKRILIDTGDADYAGEYLPVLRRAMVDAGATGLAEIVVTHWHRDHIGGVQALLEEFGRDVPVRKFEPAGGPEAVWKDGGEGTSAEAALVNTNFSPLVDGEVLRVDGATLRVLHTPGHADDHVVLMLDEERAMFTGDNVLGTGTPVFRDLPLYMRSLQCMQAERPTRLYTSHGPVVEDGQALIAEYIEHRMSRVQQVKEVLGRDGAGRTAEEITRSIYTQHPERLIGPATGNTVQALRLLQQEGAAACDMSHDLAGASAANSHPSAPSDGLLAARWRLNPSKL